jgi:hypothetical protein
MAAISRPIAVRVLASSRPTEPEVEELECAVVPDQDVTGMQVDVEQLRWPSRWYPAPGVRP